MPKKITVNCSKCGKPVSATVFDSVNSDYADDIAMQIIRGDLFDAECPHCQFIFRLEYDVLYHDLRHGAMIWVVHKNFPEYTKKVSEIRAMQIFPYKTFRIVEDMNALREKVSCLESNRDDKVIELYKAFTAYNWLSQHPDFDFKNAFYTAVGGRELIYLYDNEYNERDFELSEKTYDYLKNLFYGSRYATQIDDNYPIIDYKWAESVLIPLIKTEGDHLALNEQSSEMTTPVKNTSVSDHKVCPKCNAILPGDSAFCQDCGTKLPVSVTEPISSNNTAEELLSESDIMEVKGSHPVIIQSAHLYCSADREKYYLRCKFKSLSDKVISALMVDVFCFDVWGNELPTIRDAQVLDLSPKRGDVFGYSRKIPIADANTRTVRVKLKRIRFADGTIEDCSGEETKIPSPVPLKRHFHSPELTQQYLYETTDKSSFVPMQIGAFWMCACGEINADAENSCANCGADKQIVFHALDEKFLAERYADYIENKRIEEEAFKQEQEKKRLIEQQRQEEMERQRIAEIQRERNLAILKRAAVLDAANKRKKKIKMIAIGAVAAIIAIAIISAVIVSIYNNASRNFATETMNTDYTNVYADIVSMKPRYFVYTSYSSWTYDISEVICRCETVEGKTIWITVDIWKYPGGSSADRDKNEDQYYSASNPKRIVGKVTTAETVMDDLADKIGNVFMIDVTEDIE